MEKLGQFLEFVGAIIASFSRSYLEDSRALVAGLGEASLLDAFYVVVATTFLLGVGAVLAIGMVMSIVGRSPQPLIDWGERYVRLFAHIGAWIIVVLIGAMVYEVVARYFFEAPTQWAFEVAYMLMGTSFMLGIAYCLQMRRHIRVDFVYDHVSPRWRSVIDLVGYVLLVPMVLWLSAGLMDYFHEAYRVGETSGESAWNPIIWPFKFTFVIGFVLLLLQLLLEIVKCFMVLAGMRVADPMPVEGFH